MMRSVKSHKALLLEEVIRLAYGLHCFGFQITSERTNKQRVCIYKNARELVRESLRPLCRTQNECYILSPNGQNRVLGVRPNKHFVFVRTNALLAKPFRDDDSAASGKETEPLLN